MIVDPEQFGIEGGCMHLPSEEHKALRNVATAVTVGDKVSGNDAQVVDSIS